MVHNDAEGSKAGGIRTKFLEKTLSEGNNHLDILAAGKGVPSCHALIAKSDKSAIIKHISERPHLK